MIFVFAYQEKKQKKNKTPAINRGHGHDYDNLLFSRINGPNAYPYGPIAWEQGDIVRVHERASPLARASSRSNQPMDSRTSQSLVFYILM